MDATPEQVAEGLAIVRVLAAVLDRLVCANAHIALTDPGQVTKFHALKAPGIPVLQYLERIHKYASCSNECFILALIYVDRLIQRNNFLLTELNVHRVVITAILLAAKFFDDAYYNNAYYAKVGGVLVSEMNGLEVDFLFRINFSLHVTPDLFDKYRAELVSHSLSANLISHSSHLNLDMGSNSRMPSPLVQPSLVCAPPAPPSQSLSSMNGVHLNGCNTMMTRETASLASQITPSPPHGISAMPPPPHVACVNDNLLTSESQFVIDQHYMGSASNISTEFLQHVNNIPVDMQKQGSYTFPLQVQNRSYSPLRPYSAPTLPLMQTSGSQMIPMTTSANILGNNDRFLVMDGQMYHLQGSVAQYAGMEGSYGGVMQQQQHLSSYLQCPSLQHRHSDQSYVSRDGLVTAATPHFIGGQMITGMSGL